jgi:hypothetical protein
LSWQTAAVGLLMSAAALKNLLDIGMIEERIDYRVLPERCLSIGVERFCIGRYFTARYILAAPCSATSVGMFVTWVAMRPHATSQVAINILAVKMAVNAGDFYPYRKIREPNCTF